MAVILCCLCACMVVACGSVKKETRSRHCWVHLYPRFPPLIKKWHLNRTVSSSKEDEPFGHKEHDTPDTHPPTHTHAGAHMYAKTCTHTLTSSLCFPRSYVSIIHCLRDLPYSRSERFATAGECRTDAEHANNLLKSFYSSSLSADRFRTAPLGPDEWTCLTE